MKDKDGNLQKYEDQKIEGENTLEMIQKAL